MSIPGGHTTENIEYIQQVVYDLRIDELQHILGAFKQDQSGSIMLLRIRVLSLLTDPIQKVTNLKQKIVEVFNARLQRSLQSQQPPRKEPRNNVQIHSQSYAPPRPNPIQPFVETPSPYNIQFEHLPFFKTIQTLLQPLYCKTYINSAKITAIIHLADGVRNAIVNSWNTARQEYKVQIILRLLQVGRGENVTERLPYNIIVSVNDDECKLPTLNLPTSSGQISWRNNDPIDITYETVSSNCVENSLNIRWSEEPHKYMAGVYVVHKLTWNDLLEELKKRPVRTSDKTKELIKKSMENDADIGVEFMLATLKDPLTQLRMKLPARGVDCIHLQCFDAIPFLQMNDQKAKWTCPLCNKKIKFENIEVDEFFLNILQSPVLSEECKKVLLLKDGTWSEAKNREFSNNCRTNNCGSTNNIEVFTLSDPDDDNDEIIPKPKRFKYNPSKVGESKRGIETVDLTNPSKSDPSDKHSKAGTILIPFNPIESSTMSNNVNLPNNSTSGSNNCVAGSSGNRRSNRLQTKDNSRSGTDKPVNGGTSRPLIPLNLTESSTISNNVNLPNNSIPRSNNCVAGGSGSSRNNRHQDKDNSRPVLFVITLD